jgi:Fringe-like
MLGEVECKDQTSLNLGIVTGWPGAAPLARVCGRRPRTFVTWSGVALLLLVALALALPASTGIRRALRIQAGQAPSEESDRARIGPVYDEVLRARQAWTDVMEPAVAAEEAPSLPSRPPLQSMTPHAPAASDEPLPRWEDIMHDVVIIIKTGHEVADNRLKQLRTVGWMSLRRSVPNLLVVTDGNGTGVVDVKTYAQDVLADHIARNNASATVPEEWFSHKGWKGDKDKNLPAFHLAYKVYPGKKWYILLDDDTYIFLDNFAQFTGRYSSSEQMSQPLYTGKVFSVTKCGPYDINAFNNDSRELPNLSFAHGGSGIVLNAPTLHAMFPTIAECVTKYSSCWAGDMQVALCLNDIGIRFNGHSDPLAIGEHFTPFSPRKALMHKDYTALWLSTEMPITFHKAPENELSLLSAFDAKCRRKRTRVVYSELREHLTSNGLKFKEMNA